MPPHSFVITWIVVFETLRDVVNDDPTTPGADLGKKVQEIIEAGHLVRGPQIVGRDPLRRRAEVAGDGRRQR